MKIERLSMKNWRGFFGEHEIEFSTDNKKPITVLIGANKTGKSDILRAIHWVLFDETPEFTNKEDDLINNYAEAHIPESDPNRYAVVSLTINTGEETYKLTRTLKEDLDKSDKGSEFNIQKFDATKKVFFEENIGRDERNWINGNLLPHHLRHIYLFQGEVLAKSFTNEDEEHINKAVQNVTGTNYVIDAQKNLEAFIENKELQKAKLSAKTTKEASDVKKLAGLQQEILDLKKELDEIDDDILELNKEKNKLSTKIGRSKIQKVAAAQAKKDQAERTLQKANNEYDKASEESQALLYDYGFRIFSLGVVRKVIKPEEDDDPPTFLTGIESPEREDALLDLLKNQECICGRSLQPKKDEKWIKNIKKEVELTTSNDTRKILRNIDLEQKSITDSPVPFLKIRQSLNARRKTAQGDIESAKAIIQDATDDIKNNAQSDDELDAQKRIDEIDDNELPTLQSQRRIADSKYQNKLSEKGKIKIPKTKGTSSSGNDINIIDEIIVEAQELHKTLENFTSNQEEKIKENLKKAMVNKLTKYGTGDDQFRYLDNSFLPKLISPATQDENPQREGGDNMKSIFLGTSLVEQTLSREDTPNFIEPGVSFPFICDAPFSSLDGTNESSATKMISNLDCQIIYLVNPKAYVSGIQSELKKNNREGKRWFIERMLTGELNTPTKPIKIGSSEYIAFKGNTPREGSTVRKVKVD